MHISEGILSVPVLLSGTALAIAGISIGLRTLGPRQMMPAALFSSAFFVASLIHVPIGFSSVHLILNGLMGVALGWAAFPAVFVALVLQAFLFQFGGITTLGVNTCIMALPPVLCWYIMRPLLAAHNAPLRMIAGFACGALAVLLSAISAAGALALSGEVLLPAALALLTAHLPVALIEGTVTFFIVGFLTKVRPEFLNIPPLPGRA